MGEIISVKSDDGFSFQQEKHTIVIPEETPLFIEHIHQFKDGRDTFFLIKDITGKHKTATHLGEVVKHSLTNIQTVGFDPVNAVIVSNYNYKKRHVMFYGERSINIAFSDNLVDWDEHSKPVLVESFPLQVGQVYNMEEGLLLVYFSTTVEEGVTYHSAYLALLSSENPHKLLWKTDKPIWRQKDQWPGKKATHLGTTELNNHLITYWHVNDDVIYGVIIADAFNESVAQYKAKHKTKLDKHEANPIIAPNLGNSWEAFNTFNPAALYTAGKVHILYRAQGFDYISSIGYASSSDGITIDERSEKPVFNYFINRDGQPDVNYDFVSGGGWGGCEDPRITQIGDRVYMVYVAFDGWSPPRLAMTWIHINDFLKQRWSWSKPVMISPPGIVDKSGCLLPEKVNGKYVIFHRIFPNILIDYVDDLNFDGKNRFLKGEYQIKIRDNMWDSRKIGAGAPPLKTKDGWLLIYYGVDDKNASKYHIGAMLLDLKNPHKVLYRSDRPILEATEIYEMNGFKPGIAYPCGAAIVDEQLLVYYGGADSVVCVATAQLDTFLANLKANKSQYLNNVQVKQVTV
jgi:predicted GH43/DUF377 family glycosyl hydrolase